ncbi:serine/threonine protein kinase [Gimesia aquarii]|uniref:Serine/threonine-protein kinase PrkC n=1 Tax=Gimesia aquarii TaxID=2527964 RepID=A0A517WV24_9PLAN|nr:serine/threonine-protein kinase [Gimesia aquarii]QDU09117.1 Serine/threonine-protein kinase PrkC [Gimesia aquarii]
MNFLNRFFSKEPKTPRVNIKKRFELIGRVGQGSMSKVWRARDSQSGRVVALKVLHKQKTLELESRFVGLNKPKEGEIAVQLNHPHIVKTFEHGLTTEGEQFLVMEFVEGYSLSFLVEAQNEDMRTNCLKYMIQLGEAIKHFHEENWIHRDICPRNILVSNDHELKLIDFGLVVPNTAPFLQPGNRTGTAAYMAPELIKRQKTSQKIDIFSYSVTCYEMLTKRLPWEAAETLDAVLQHINTPPENIQQLLPDLNPQVADAIMKGLELYPQDRWQTIEDMLKPLRAALKVNQKLVESKTTQSLQTDHFTLKASSKPKRKRSVSDKPTHRANQRRKSKKKNKTTDSFDLRQDQTPPEVESSVLSDQQEQQAQDPAVKSNRPPKKKTSSKPIPKNPDETI